MHLRVGTQELQERYRLSSACLLLTLWNRLSDFYSALSRLLIVSAAKSHVTSYKSSVSQIWILWCTKVTDLILYIYSF